MDKTNKGIAIGIAIGLGVGFAVGIIIGPKLFDSSSSDSEDLQALLAYQEEQFSSVEAQAEEVSCRSNLRSLGSAEAMFYGAENRYGTIAEIVSSCVMSNADQLTCPTCNRGYSATILDDGESYRISCPRYGSENHGEIEDGIVSWY